MHMQYLRKIKKIIKYGCGKFLGADTDRIEREVRKAKIISFDIFDTLVKRNVISPECVHNIVHDEFLSQTGIDVPKYTELRIDAEMEARRYSKKEEISLEDIFDFLNCVSDRGKKKLQEIEEETELAVCCPDLRMKTIYEKALMDGKRIIITSDMYLDEKVIKKILNKCGYEHYEKLYLSSSYGLCKSTGSIYEVIKRDYSDFIGKILHIGDNIKADYFAAKKKGLDALLIDGQRNLLRYWKKNNNKIENTFLYGSLYSFINNQIYNDASDAVHIAYEVLGPMLLGYCTWLNEKIKSDNIEKIFFLSREGKILQEAFNILYPQSKIPQTYLYVSRQALVVPLLADANDFDEMIDILKVFFHRPFLKTICVLCDLDQKEFNYELSCIGLNEETKIHEIPNEKKEEVYNVIKRIGGNYFKQQQEYVSKYLSENAFLMGNVAIVDIGWSGTMQIALQKYITNIDTTLRGYYLGVRNMEKDDYYTSIYRMGYLFEPESNKEFDLMTRFTTDILELLFLNQSGSVKKYDLKKNKVIPVLAKSEYVETEGKFVESLQGEVLGFLTKICEDRILKANIRIPLDIIMDAYSRFAVYPSMNTIKMFEGFQFFNSGNVRKVLPEHSIFYYMIHVNKLKNDLNESVCKIFFLKKLFKINIPYFNFLKLIVSKFNIESKFRKRFYRSGEK